MRAVNLTRPLLLPPCARHRPGQGVGVAEDGDRPTRVNPALVPSQPCHRAAARPEPRSGWYPGGWGHAHVQTTLDISGWFARTRHCVRRRTGRPTPPPGSCTMIDNGRNQFRPRTSTRLLGFGGSCPHPVARAGHRVRHRKSGPGFTENGERRLALTGLPDPFPAESDWRAHWQ